MTKSVLTFYGFWHAHTPSFHRNFLFIYSDNDAKIGKDGQAVIRDSSNSIGIPTIKFPTNEQSSFYTDEELENNKKNIDEAIQLIKSRVSNYTGIILPESGIGTGIAKLDVNAPKTYEYLKEELIKLIEYIRNYSE